MNKIILAVGTAMALVGIKLVKDNVRSLEKVMDKVNDTWDTTVRAQANAIRERKALKNLEKKRREREKWLEDNEIYFT